MGRRAFMVLGLCHLGMYCLVLCLDDQDVECRMLIELYCMICMTYRASSIRIRYFNIRSERASFIRPAIR
jgi:hypothetical protein